MKWYRSICTNISPELFREKNEKGKGMISAMGVAPAGIHATAAVFDISAVVKQPMERRDDVVAPIGETTNGQASKSDLSLLKMTDPAVGRTLNIKV
jgi:hypothetical protein